MGTAAVAVAGIGLAAMVVFRGGDKDETGHDVASIQESEVVVLEQVTGEGAVYRPHVRLEHPAGAVADVPGGPVIYGTGVDLKRIQLRDTSPAWDRGSVAWRFESLAGITIPAAVELDLPGIGAAGETVIAQSQLGAWIELPSEATTLPNGQPGRRLEVRDIPAPWVVAVAKPRPGFSGTTIENEAVRLETLYWTDRDAWLTEVKAWLPEAEVVLADRPVGYASLRAPTSIPANFAFELEKALRLLGGARIAMASSSAALAGGPFTASLPGTGVNGFQLYVAGIDQLARLRADWVVSWKLWESQGYPRNEMLFDSSGTTIEEALESALYTWAPWGVDFTRWLVRTQTVPAFDLRVLRPFGQLYFTDVRISGEGDQSHPTMEAGIKTASEPFVGGSVTVTRYLRFYSTWAIEDTSWIDTFRDWKAYYDIASEAYDVIMATAGLAVGTLTPVGFVASVAVTLSGHVIDYIGEAYAQPDDGQAWAQFEVYGTDAVGGAGLPAALAWAEAKSANFHVLLANNDDAVFEFKKKDIASALFDVTITALAVSSDWYMLKDVRAISKGTEGYCPLGDCGTLYSTAIPPVQGLAIVNGALKPEAKDDYPASGVRLLAWDMQYVGDTKPNLHELFHSSYDLRQDSEWRAIGKLSLNQPKKGKWAGGLADLPFEPHHPETGPVSLSYAYRTQPQMQAIRLAIPNATLKTIASEYKLGSSPDFKDYGLRLVVKASDGTRNVFPLEEVAQPRTGDKKDTTYVTVQLTRDGFEPEEEVLESLPDGYIGARQRMEEGILRTKLTGTIAALADQSDRLSYIIDFATAPARLVQADPGVPDSPRVHLIDVAGVESAGLFVGTTSQGEPIEIKVDFTAGTWEVQRWGLAATATKAPGGGICNGEAAVIGLAAGILPADLKAAEQEYARYMLSGIIVNDRLARPAPPAAWTAAGEDPLPPYVTEDFGKMNSARTAISGTSSLWGSEIMGCPLITIGYTAQRQ